MASLQDIIRDLGDDSKLSIESLEVIKSALADLSIKNRLQFNSQVSNCNLSVLFDVLLRIDRDLLQVYCEVLRTLLDCLSPHLFLETYGGHLEKAFEMNACNDVQNLALHQISRCAKDPKTADTLLERQPLLLHVLDRLAIPELSCLAKSVILDMTGYCQNSVRKLFQGDLLKKFEALQKKGSVVNLRVLELYCNVAVQSEENCKKMTPFLSTIVQSIKKERNDVLVLLNYIELLSLLLEQPHSLKFVIESSAVENLKELLSNREDPMSSLFLPGLIVFLGNFGQHAPTILICDHKVCLRTILELTSDPNLSCAAIAAIAAVARSQEGKRCLQKEMQREFSNYLKTLGGLLLGHAKPEQKVTALQSLTAILELEDSDQDDINAITEEWTKTLSPNSLQLIWGCAKAPFEDIRINALKVLRNIAIASWGRKSLLSLPGFYEWLLDRSTEPEKAGKEGKHSIASALLEDSNSIEDQSKATGLRRFVNEGPFYTPGDYSVVSGGV